MAPPRRRAEPAPGAVRGALAGRARDALFGLGLGGADAPRLVELDVAAVRPNPGQPRRAVDEAGIAELAASVERHGLLQPILVREDGAGGYELVAGQRRLLAHARLGRERIAALVADPARPPDELALVENLQRRDLAPLDEAEAVAALRARRGWSQDELAKALGRAKSSVSELLSLGSLPDAIKAAVRTSEPPAAKSVLVELARLNGDPAAQEALWRRLRGAGRPDEPGATVRAARAARKVRTSEPAGGVRTSEPGAPPSPALASSRDLLGRLGGLDAAAVRAEPALAAALDALRERLDALLPPPA